MTPRPARKIADELAKQIRTDDRLDHVFTAVIDVLVFALGCMCPDCRQRQMQWLKANADQILAEANRQAHEMPPDECNNLHRLH